MSFVRGTRLGPYEITEPLGAGGMGEVYRATDTRLRREVAIKVVAERWQGQPELHSRFRVEAEAVAKLNHPHICQIYDIGTHDGAHFIVMEVVDGETLAARLARGPLPIRQALQVAAEIAGALGAAHQAGIVHRDIKPANVILGRNGAKLLDFGLAQLSRPASALDITDSTVGPRDLTEPGSPVGTWHYMPPEQIRGEAADTRSDVFALGALMYEMVAGRRAFNGATHHELVTAILTADPPALETLAATVPESYASIVRTCLSKLPEDRWHSAADVRRALDAAHRDVRTSRPVPPSRATGWAVALALVAFAGGLFTGSTDPTPAKKDLVRSTLDLGRFAVTGNQNSIVFAPDGKSIIYAGRAISSTTAYTALNQLYRHSLETGVSEAIEGTEALGEGAGGTAARMPFISPDGLWLGFENTLQFMKLPIGGGRPVPITPSNYSSAHWGDDHYIVFGGPNGGGLRRVSANGGEVTVLTTLRPEDEGRNHLYPIMLPGSRTVLFGVGNGPGDEAKIVVEDVRTHARKDLVTGTMAFRYSPTGHIVYARGGAIFAQAFDVSQLAVAGAAIKIADGVVDRQAAEFAVSAAGDLAFVPANPQAQGSELVLVTLDGAVTATGQTGTLEKPRFSRDGKWLSVIKWGNEPNVWIYDLVRTTFDQFTFGRYLDAIWNTDGSLTLTDGRPSKSRLVTRPRAANAADTAITPYADAADLPIGWIDGGRRLLFERHARAEHNIWAVATGRQPERVVVTPFSKNRTSVSPDGRWLSYTSVETSKTAQVYLQRLDVAAPRVQVSIKNGAEGAWSPDSRRLYFYASASDGENAVWSVDIGEGPNPDIGVPVERFKAPGIGGPFALSPDGKRFAMIRRLNAPIQTIRLVQNWPRAFDTPAK
jgi:serine/threonine protein kinase